LTVVSVAVADIDFASRTMRLAQDGFVVSTGRGSDCLGSPVSALPRPRRGSDRVCDRPLRSGRDCSHGVIDQGRVVGSNLNGR
jgi:2-keto-4-pentenoate hydratase